MRSIQILSITVFMTIFIQNSYAQSDRNVFIGVQPAITVEPFYQAGELDLNVFPIIIETPIHDRISIRFVPIINYHLGGVINGVSDVSLFTVLPVFLNKIEDNTSKPYGFYIGPVLGFGRNLLNEHYTTTIALEPGYMFEAKKRFSITLGLQLGASFFHYDSEPNESIFHWGPKVTFGFWLK